MNKLIIATCLSSTLLIAQSISFAAIAPAGGVPQREASEAPRGKDAERPGDRQKRGSLTPATTIAREASEAPRGRDHERVGDRQKRGSLTPDTQIAREASEAPRGRDNERVGDRHGANHA